MKKLVITALALCMGLMTATAQITTGESSSQVVRTGNRAEAGDFGLYLGATSDMFKNIVDGFDVQALPLLNFKYMISDKLEARLGLEWWTAADGNKAKGELNDEDFKTKKRNKYTDKYLYPGIAYHFSKSNILDVYVGAELPIGWEKTVTANFADYGGKDYDVDTKEIKREFNIGLGAFVGMQAYVANLPLAIGVEYGISSLKTISSSKFITAEEQDYKDPKVSNNTWKVGQQARLTLTYFFKL